METLEFEIRGFVHFNYSGIRRLVWKPETPIQVILGTNGSGKSRLTKQMLLSTANRSDYNPTDGYMKHTIRHNGSIYVYGTDFSKKSSPHFFFKDDVCLNESGNTGVQDDLLREHFGLTPIKASVLSGRLDLATMSGAGRKTFFMTASPYQLEYILDQHKKVSSAVRACKNTLTHLTERKVALETELLSDTILEKLRSDVTILNDKIVALIGHTHAVGSLQREARSRLAELSTLTVPVITVDNVDQYLRDLADNIKTIQKQLLYTSSVPRDCPDNHLASLQTEGARIEERKAGLDIKYAELDAEVTRLKETVIEIERTRQVGDIDAEIQRLSAKVREIESEPSFTQNVPDKSAVDTIRDILPALRNVLSSLIDLRYPMVPYAQLQQERDAIRTKSDILSRNCAIEESISNEIAQLSCTISISRQDVPDSPCAKEACPLFREFNSLYQRNREKLSTLQQKHADIVAAIAADQAYLDEHTERVNHLWRFVPTVQELLQYLNGTKALRDLFIKDDVLKLISTAPAAMLERINDLYSSAHTYHSVYVPAKEELGARLQEKANSEKLSAGETEMLRRMLETKEGELYRIASDIRDANTQYGAVKASIASTQRYIAASAAIVQLTAQHDAVSQRALIEHELYQLHELSLAIKAEKDAYVEELANVQGTLSRQDALKARYNEEVLHQIDAVAQKRNELIEIERSLSPTSGIPHIYSITFINEVIDIANEYIERMWGYPFGIVPLDPSKPLDYGQFPIFVGESSTPDMSECSDAQVEMLNLALTLALRKVLGLSDYPLHLDEIGRSFDQHHKQQLLHLLRGVVDDGDCSQLFLINHHAVVHEGLVHSQVLILNEANILRPPSYNQHAEIERR